MFDGFLNQIQALFGPIGVLAVLALAGVFLFFYNLRLPANTKFESRDSDAVAAERLDYVGWRDGLARGGRPEVIYSAMLGRVLDAVDRFFGDPPDSRTGRAPAWGARALDRCYLIALIYPVLSVMVFWHVTGTSGALETALLLPSGTSDWERALSAISLLVCVSTLVWAFRSRPDHRPLIRAVIRLLAGACALAFAVAGAVVGAFAFAVAFAVAFSAAFTFTFAGAVAVASAFAVAGAGAFAGAGAVASAVAFAVAGAGAFAAAGAGAGGVMERIERSRFTNGLVPVLIIFGLAMTAASIAVAGWFSPEPGNEDARILLVFFTILPVVNAIFDWISIGMTRRLLRLGQSKGGLWPIFLAGLDLVFATAFLFALALVMVGAIDVFNRASGVAVLDVGELLSLYRLDPGDPRLFWVYVVVITTYFPSLLNLVLGGLACVRGIPCVRSYLTARVLPEDPIGLTVSKRVEASALLTVQVFVAVFGALFVGGVLLGLVLYGLDWIGLGLYSTVSNLHAYLSGI